MSLLFVSDVPLACINQAAATYHIPAKLIIAVLNIERGKVGMAKKNTNGTYDLGPMQINSSWQSYLLTHSVTLEQVKNDACTNVTVGTWILSKNIADNDNLFRGLGDYNSNTPNFNTRYSLQVRIKYTSLSQWLSDNNRVT